MGQSPLPLAVLASQVSREREDLQFLTDKVSIEKTPAYEGYNTRHATEQGHSVKAKTKAVYLPLIARRAPSSNMSRKTPCTIIDYKTSVMKQNKFEWISTGL